MAWSSLSGDDAEPGWRAIALPAAGPLDLRAGRRSPDNAEAVLVGFPSARMVAADKLPEGQGFAVERADPEGEWTSLARIDTQVRWQRGALRGHGLRCRGSAR